MLAGFARAELFSRPPAFAAGVLRLYHERQNAEDLSMRVRALLVLLLAGCNPAMAQTYPSKPVTLIVPYAPGGATDTIARLTAQALWEEFGQSFIVDNRGGGGGMIGVEAAARAMPDGYTLLFSSTGPVTISPLLFKNRDFDPLARLTPIVE